MSRAISMRHSRTFGEVFRTFMIELVMPVKAVDPYLLLWDGQHAYIERRLHITSGSNSGIESCIYEHPDVDPTIWNAIRLPTHAADYGSTQQLLTDLCKLIHQFVGLTEPAVQIAAHAVLVSWFSDCRTCSVCVSIAGASHTAGVQLFQLLSSLYRRAFVLDAASLSSFSSVPSEICCCPFIEGSKNERPMESRQAGSRQPDCLA